VGNFLKKQKEDTENTWFAMSAAKKDILNNRK